MPIRPILDVAKGQNGLGAFILQCRKLDFHYCDWGGSSVGMNGFIKSLLPEFAAKSSSVEITVSPRPKKFPVIIGHYINGKQKAICVGNKEPLEILRKAEILRDSSGAKNKKFSKPVTSVNPSVRGVWSPHHGGGMRV